VSSASNVIPFPRRATAARTPSELTLKVYVDRVAHYAECTTQESATVVAEALTKSRAGESMAAIVEQSSQLARALVRQRRALAQGMPL
jgi:transcriptional regulator of heat shock response